MPTFRATVQLDWPGVGGPGTNTWHFRDTSVTGDEPLLPMEFDVQAFYSAIAARMGNGWTATWDGTAIQDPYGDPSYATGNGWTVSAPSGADPSTAHAAQCCVTWRTASATRSGRGRTFCGPLARNQLADDGTLPDTVLATFRDAAAALVDSNSGAGNLAAIGVYSHKQGVLRDITGYLVNDRIAWLRSRSN